MLILLSCAKTMDCSTLATSPLATIPLFQKEAENIAKLLRAYSVSELSDILKVNSAIAAENVKRYKEFGNINSAKKQAILAYNGIVFKKMGIEDFTDEDFEYAQNHLRITSFCYGYLRPMDLINEYRLEGNVVLDNLSGKNMYDYWKPLLTNKLIEDTKKVGGILYNLASAEMKKLFNWKKVEKELKVISPEFKIMQNGKLKTIVIYTKMARGETARYIIKNKIDNPDKVIKF